MKFWIAITALALCALALVGGGNVLSPASFFQPESLEYRILMELRVPRFLMAFLVGGSLAVLGGTYQVLFQNALAEPYLLGIASAVTLGAASAELVFGFPSSGVGGFAIGFAAAMVVTGLLVLLSLSKMARDSNRLVLFGMAINFVLSSILFLLVTYFYQGFGVGSLRWLFGQMPWVKPTQLAVVYAVALPLLAILWIFGRRLDGMSLGDEVARTLGVSPRETRVVLLFVSSALLALTVTAAGAIGFVGLVTPHVSRMVFRPGSQRVLFVVSFFLGAVFLAVCDAAARAIAPPLEFPVGVITTLVGGPVFLWLLWRRA